MAPPKRQCVARSTTTGKQCQKAAIKGGTVCPSHGGASPKVAANAAVRAEVMNWGLGDTNVDPGELLLRLVTQAGARAERYGAELGRIVGESESLEKALIESAWGEFGKQGEFVKGLVRLEGEERDRAATFATKAIAAGLAERQVRIAERQGAQVVALLRAFAARLGHDPADPGVIEAMTTELRAITGGAA